MFIAALRGKENGWCERREASRDCRSPLSFWFDYNFTTTKEVPYLCRPFQEICRLEFETKDADKEEVKRLAVSDSVGLSLFSWCFPTGQVSSVFVNS